MTATIALIPLPLGISTFGLKPPLFPPFLSLQVEGDMSATIALILLPVGIFMCGYALAMFVLRARDITHHTQKLIEDRRWAARFWEGGFSFFAT